MNTFRRILLAALYILLFQSTVQAQLFENFESGEKSSYSGASVTLTSGDWFLDDALIGSLSNDKYNGTRGVRMDRRDGKTGNIYMQFDKPNGADEVSFYLAHYGNNAEEAALQVQYSLDGGNSWTNIGDELFAPFDLTEFSIPVQVDGNIRFKFVQSSGTDRMNIDDIRITDYIAPQEEPSLIVTINEEVVDSGSTVTFETTLTGNTSEIVAELKNVGSDTLRFSEVIPSVAPFSISDLQDSVLAFNETTEITLYFSPNNEGSYTYDNGLDIRSNINPFKVNLTGEAVASDGIIPIATARELPEGTIVSLAGVVTVSDEFAGPMYFQDETGGIAWFYSPMRDDTETFFANVNRGDSIIITGELGSFNELKQIVGDTPQFEFRATGDNAVPIPITVQELNSGLLEGLLVSMNVEIGHAGALQGNTNYDITDATGSAVMRISSFTNIVGSTAPDGATTIVGVVGNFRGTYQLTPRDLNDIDAEVNVIPGEDVPLDETFDVVTWNIEWFGSASNSPDDDVLQFENVKTVITTIDADVYALQEISNESLFNDLVTDLTDYEGIYADYSQTQNTAYLYKSSTIQRRNSRLITSGMNQSDWANGRYPFYFQFNATINGEVREINMFNIHAKAFSEQTDYNQRLNASNQMKTYLDSNHSEDNVIFLGDFNDEILVSTVGGNESPYMNFDDDLEYTIVTKTLEQAGFTSFSSSSMIDHIVFSSELSDEYFMGTERVENTSYVGSYLSTTSDHFPVWVRFHWGPGVSNEIEEVERTLSFSLDQNFPNPFNPNTVISYQLTDNSFVNLKVFDAVGREVAILENGLKSAGIHQVTFDASSLSSGLYFYQLQSLEGIITKKMLLVK